MGNSSKLRIIKRKLFSRILPAFKKMFKFIPEFLEFSKQNQKNNRFPVKFSDCYPIFHESTASTGFDRHYVYHTSWAVRKLKEINPEKHIDISSSLFFVGSASAFFNIEFYDYRPADLILSNLHTGAADLTNLHFADNSIKSLSCMHVIEHIGLGRYGDELDSDGDLKAINELKRVVAIGGVLLFVVPVGKPRVHFNAHRIYSYEQIKSYFSGFRIEEFTLISDNPEDGGLIINPNDEILSRQYYGCGCFKLVKELAKL